MGKHTLEERATYLQDVIGALRGAHKDGVRWLANGTAVLQVPDRSPAYAEYEARRTLAPAELATAIEALLEAHASQGRVLDFLRDARHAGDVQAAISGLLASEGSPATDTHYKALAETALAIADAAATARARRIEDAPTARQVDDALAFVAARGTDATEAEQRLAAAVRTLRAGRQL